MALDCAANVFLKYMLPSTSTSNVGFFLIAAAGSFTFKSAVNEYTSVFSLDKVIDGLT